MGSDVLMHHSSGRHRRLRAITWAIAGQLSPSAAAGNYSARRHHEPGSSPPPRASPEMCAEVAALGELVPLAKQRMKKECAAALRRPCQSFLYSSGYLSQNADGFSPAWARACRDWEFMRGGSDTETSVRRNRLAIDALALCPRMATVSCNRRAPACASSPCASPLPAAQWSPSAFRNNAVP